MKAFAIPSFGAPPALIDLPEPRTGPGVTARIRFAGVNPIDWKSIDRLTADDTFPSVLGQDFAGDATHAEDADDVAPGDRVFGIAGRSGAYAEATRVAAQTDGECVARIPDGLSYEDAAALPTSGLTALAAIDALEIEQHATLVVFGATGGVGSVAVQVAKAAGAYVVAIVRGDAGEAAALGADEVIVSGKGDDPIKALRRKHPQGVDAILDVVNAAGEVEHDVAALVPGGRIVSTIRALDEEKLREAGFRARNVNLFESPLASAHGLTRLAQLVVAGTVRVRIAEIQELVSAPDVLSRAKNGTIGTGHALLRAT